MKKSFKAIILFIGLFGILHPIQAQKEIVLESSQKKKPDWVNGLVKDYIIVVATSPTLDDAQQKCLAKVKEQIISSVAENIQTSSEYFRSEKINNNNSDFSENFQTATKTRAADIPFIKGISLTNVESYYWEKIEIDKKAKTFKYYYHIKYPFSQQQLKMLILEFEKADRKLTEQLEELLNKIDVLTNLEEMGQTTKELEALSSAFFETDPRKDKANVGIAKLKEMQKNFSIETINSTLGEIRVQLKIGEKMITTSRKPQVRSNCAKIIDVRSKSPEWVITYAYDECYEDPDNAIKVEFMSSYGKAKSEFPFNITAEKIDIFVNNDVNFSGGTDSGTEITDAKCQISITSKYSSPFEIEKVILNFGNETPIIVENINKTFQAEGKHDLEFTINQALSKEIYSAKINPTIKGTIHYKSSKTGEKSIYKMYNQKITTSW